jgi:hypothetical protein
MYYNIAIKREPKRRLPQCYFPLDISLTVFFPLLPSNVPTPAILPYLVLLTDFLPPSVVVVFFFP